MSRSPSPQPPARPSRTTHPPFLLPLTYRTSSFTPLPSFPLPTPNNPKPALPPHVEIYTWMDCTLRELALLLTGALPSLVHHKEKVVVGTRLVFRLVYPDMRSLNNNAGGPGGPGHQGRLLGEEGRGRYIAREMGSVVVGAPSRDAKENGHANGNGDAAAAGLELEGEDADKTLEEVRFVIGDFVDVAVFPPLSDGTVVSRGSVVGGRGGRGENGYSGRGGGYAGDRDRDRDGRGFRGGGFGGRNDAATAQVPPGEWRRGERLPGGDGGGGGYRGGGRGRGRW